MIVKEAKYRKVRRIVREQVSPEVYGCDCCKKAINMGLSAKLRAHLELTVFYNSARESERMHFCSWRCVLKKLPTIKTDYFISLPYLTYDGPDEKGLQARDFFVALRSAITPPIDYERCLVELGEANSALRAFLSVDLSPAPYLNVQDAAIDANLRRETYEQIVRKHKEACDAALRGFDPKVADRRSATGDSNG